MILMAVENCSILHGCVFVINWPEKTVWTHIRLCLAKEQPDNWGLHCFNYWRYFYTLRWLSLKLISDHKYEYNIFGVSGFMNFYIYIYGTLSSLDSLPWTFSGSCTVSRVCLHMSSKATLASKNTIRRTDKAIFFFISWFTDPPTQIFAF